MAEKRHDSDWEQRKNEKPEEGRGTKEEAKDQRPYDRLKDGTNDLKNGDANLGEPSEKASTDKPTKETGA